MFASRSSGPRRWRRGHVLGAAHDRRTSALEALADPVADLVREREAPAAGALRSFAAVDGDEPVGRDEHPADRQVVHLLHAQTEEIFGDRLDRHRNQCAAEELVVARAQLVRSRVAVVVRAASSRLSEEPVDLVGRLPIDSSGAPPDAAIGAGACRPRLGRQRRSRNGIGGGRQATRSPTRALSVSASTSQTRRSTRSGSSRPPSSSW